MTKRMTSKRSSKALMTKACRSRLVSFCAVTSSVPLSKPWKAMRSCTIINGLVPYGSVSSPVNETPPRVNFWLLTLVP